MPNTTGSAAPNAPAGPAAARPVAAAAIAATGPLLGLQCLTVFDAEGETVLPVRELRYMEVAARK